MDWCMLMMLACFCTSDEVMPDRSVRTFTQQHIVSAFVYLNSVVLSCKEWDIALVENRNFYIPWYIKIAIFIYQKYRFLYTKYSNRSFLQSMDCKNDLFEYLVSKLFWLYVKCFDTRQRTARRTNWIAAWVYIYRACMNASRDKNKLTAISFICADFIWQIYTQYIF